MGHQAGTRTKLRDRPPLDPGLGNGSHAKKRQADAESTLTKGPQEFSSRLLQTPQLWATRESVRLSPKVSIRRILADGVSLVACGVWFPAQRS